MIKDLDDSLKELFEVELERMLSDSIAVVFDPPDDNFRPPSGRTVDCFLYDVRENSELRSNEWLIERQSNGAYQRKPPLVRVDCSYLITAWLGDIGSEHQLLGQVLKVLLRYPTLPNSVLHGSLVGQQPPLPTTAIQPARLQSLGEFWQALGGKPKASLNYTVTIGIEPFEPLEGTLVTNTQIQLRQGLQE
ncbi:MAG: DUF4255 domain-containing protein [Pseudanabaenales cyanobacterium]|nr:DUF4255 domain-containing protein [Pseudanabaenales cyanobacterium]